MDVIAPNMLDGFVGLGARFDSHPQLEQHVGSCIDNCRTARLTRSQFSIYIVHEKLGNLKDYSAVVLEGKSQQHNDSTYNNHQTNSNFMNRHVQSQPHYPDSFYNRHQNDADPSYAHNFDVSNYYVGLANMFDRGWGP
ncbi:hypothetical protein QE152_g245 [Popillia japonica]|uniref:Uncharacterized protein n=1 Tax=Popillia japonica TaxID=7064 RepID=A0AAW1NKA8_POPJA